MIPVLLYPSFDPVIVQVGPFAIRWYALAYVVGLVLGWLLLRRLVREVPVVATSQQVDDFLIWATLAVVLGGRLGYALFYQPLHYIQHPMDIVTVWRCGMSFHGGALGVTIAIIVYTRRHGLSLLGFADRLAVCAPIGLGLGRIANFINGELWGRPAPDWLPWAMIFPQAGPVPRHPSEIYEAILEGLVLFIVLYALSRRQDLRARPGFLTGAFLLGYGIARIVGEFFREPDVFLGFLPGGTTMGQALSIPMAIAGLCLIAYGRHRLLPGPSTGPRPLAPNGEAKM